MSGFLKTKATTYLVSNEFKPCFECKELANKIDIYSEQYFCSDECVNEFYKREVDKAERMDSE